MSLWFKPAVFKIKKGISAILMECPSVLLYFVGHTDGTGKFGLGFELSERRRFIVKNAMFPRYGINGSRLSAHGVGPLSSAFTNDTPDGRSKNR
jgi:outer membrane protein OmpA-like peptidoglycan-associated protein